MSYPLSWFNGPIDQSHVTTRGGCGKRRNGKISTNTEKSSKSRTETPHAATSLPLAPPRRAEETRNRKITHYLTQTRTHSLDRERQNRTQHTLEQ